MENEKSETELNAERNKKSFASTIIGLDIYTKFKVLCAYKNITVRHGLKEAILKYMKEGD